MPVNGTFGAISTRGFGALNYVISPATSFVTLSATSSSVIVPSGYNAIHIQAAVGGGGGGIMGADYDTKGGESAGPGGGSGAYISDKIFSVKALETLTLVAGALGIAGNPNAASKYAATGGTGTASSLSGSVTGSIFSLGGGVGAYATSGNLRTNFKGLAGTATISGTAFTFGNFNQSNIIQSITVNTSGPVGVFNQSGNGADGDISGTNNCSGDNCKIGGSNGAASYAGVIAGGIGSPVNVNTAGTAGTRGSGGGGGGAQYGNFSGSCTAGGSGGNGEITYRFLQVKY